MQLKQFRGRSNVSAAVALDQRYFIVADDEDNQLSVFDQHQTKALKPSIMLSDVFDGEIQDGKRQEIDLEGATRIGDVYFWIGSHSTNSEGKPRPARQRLFGIHLQKVKQGKFKAHRCGSIYTQLINDLNQDPRYAVYDFEGAATIAPKEPGGISIEGLVATPDQGLLIGCRNPLTGGTTGIGKTILVHLLNPLALLQGQPAQFAAPIELDLGGLGIRDIARRQKHQYLIVAGPYHANLERQEQHRLYLWDSVSGELDRLDHIDLAERNIEAALFFPGQNDHVTLLSDDGEEKGFACMTLAL